MGRVRSVREVLATDPESAGEVVKVNGWVRTRRDSKAGVSFIELNDGSCLRNLQIVAEHSRPDVRSILAGVSNGCSLSVEGTVERSPGKGQTVEVHATKMEVVGPADPATYPLQKKRHSFEFLREIAHLRPRTNTIGAAMRVRNRISFAIHEFLEERDFVYIHTPIITASDCEGAGDVFRVTTLDPCLSAPASEAEGPPQDFFGRPTFLTVSGQLQAEIFALALGKVYTFGPTFRAENSNTSRHLAEFWMVEPEMAFCDLQGDLELAEALVKHVVQAVLDRCGEDIEFFARFMDANLRDTLEQTVREPFEVIAYTEAVELLERSGEAFSFPVAWGSDLQAEHERYLTERVFKRPVAILNFPRSLKPFYMRVNDDGRTVAAMDILVPRIGEIIGGSQREERRDRLLEQMQARSVPVEDYRWYVELREWGTAPHAGFGLGLERMVQYCTGIANIREVIPFPRTPGHAEF
jgi:asparaginyl-tRNA synthetase